jgi:hypothetical protein
MTDTRTMNESSSKSGSAALRVAPNALAPIFCAYEADRRAIRLTGRSLSDLEIDPADGKIRPLLEILRRELRSRHGIALINYSFAGGLDWDRGRMESEADQRTIEGALRAHGLFEVQHDRDQLVQVIQGVSRMSRASHSNLAWANGRPMMFAFHFLFGEHVVPDHTRGGSPSASRLAVIELAVQTAESLALRASGNFLIISAREGLLDPRVDAALHRVHLPQPDETAKAGFDEAVMILYPDTRVEKGLTPSVIAHLTLNTPNAPIEGVLRASRNTGNPVSAADLARERSRAVAELSEGTLRVLDTEAVEHLDFAGRNVRVPMNILLDVAAALRRGDTATPRALVLAGPPGTGKSLVAQLVALHAGVAAFDGENPKGSLVGETERRANLLIRLQREWAPNTIRHDEITESLPMQRQEFNGDNGTTNAWIAILLTSLADETLRGRSLVIGTTNCPWRMGEAQRSRTEFLPFLFPLREDFAEIVVAVTRNFHRGIELDSSDARIREAGEAFYSKGAGPRAIVQALNRVLIRRGGLGPADALFAARDYCGATDLDSVIYSDLWAIAVTESRSYLPWADDPASYPFPPHLAGIVDPRSGDIDRKALGSAIERLRPHANV